MPSNAISGVGVKFRRWTNGAWAEVAEISAITGPGMSRETIDVTTLGSTDGYREFIAGFRNPGTVVLTMNFTRDGWDTMKSDFESDDKQNYEIVFPDDDNTSFEFEGLVTELPLTIAADDKISMEVTLQISGPVTTESGSGPSPG